MNKNKIIIGIISLLVIIILGITIFLNYKKTVTINFLMENNYSIIENTEKNFININNMYKDYLSNKINDEDFANKCIEYKVINSDLEKYSKQNLNKYKLSKKDKYYNIYETMIDLQKEYKNIDTLLDESIKGLSIHDKSICCDLYDKYTPNYKRVLGEFKIYLVDYLNSLSKNTQK